MVFWLVGAVIVVVVLRVAWWSSGCSRPDTKPNAHLGAREHQARGDSAAGGMP
jgi:hypothetical protein